MSLNCLKFGLLIVTNDFLDDILQGIDEVFKSHLVAVEFIAHDLNEYEVVVVLGNPLVGHPLKLR